MKAFLFFISLLILVPACQNKQAPVSDTVLGYEKISYATGFGIAKFKNHQQVFVINGKDTLWGLKSTERDKARQKTIVLSTVFAGFMEALNLRDKIIAVDKIDYYCDSILLAAFKKGDITAVGEEGNVNMEKLLRMKPDFLVASTFMATDPVITAKLKVAGVKILPCDNFKENHPLARAEWIRFFGFIYNQEKQADSLFAMVEKNYQAIAADNRQKSPKPLVMTDAMYSGAWNVPGALTYTARIIEDAGGTYVFNDKKDNYTYPLNLESVYKQAAETDIWIHVNLYKSLSELETADKRYADFKPFRNKKVFNYNKRENKNGGNDFWEQGVVRPDLVLNDLLRIFTEENIRTSDLYFYRRLD